MTLKKRLEIFRFLVAPAHLWMYFCAFLVGCDYEPGLRMTTKEGEDIE